MNSQKLSQVGREILSNICLVSKLRSASDVATKLYPHQKKALTFLLEREREKPGVDGKFSSLWQPRIHPITQQRSWYHIVTQQEVYDEPQEAKGAILADDVRHHIHFCLKLVAKLVSLDGTRQNHHLCIFSRFDTGFLESLCNITITSCP